MSNEMDKTFDEMGNSFDIILNFFGSAIVTILLIAGKLILIILKHFFILLKNGLIEMYSSRSRMTFLLIILTILVSGLIYKLWEQKMCFIPFVFLLLIYGIKRNIKFHQRNKIPKICEEIGLKTKSGELPIVLKTIPNQKNKKRMTYIIKSKIPFDTWDKNKHLLEQYLNSKVKLLQTGQKQVIKLLKLG